MEDLPKSVSDNASLLDTLREKQREWYLEKYGIPPVQWGSSRAKVVLISQAPSRAAINDARPFSDASGRRLRHDWLVVEEGIFWNPDLFYFTAVSLIFPGQDSRGSDIRPTVNAAKIWLEEELSLLTPEIFLILGSLAANFLFPTTSYKDLIHRDQILLGRKAVILPHPSPRNNSWLKQNPEFEQTRLTIIQKYVRQAIAK